MNKIIRFGIIGCGRIGTRHAERIAQNSRAELVSLCDIKQDRIDELKNNYKVESFFNYHDLLKNDNIDVVSICTPNGLHSEMSIAAANSGKHILCEKPMTIKVDDGKKMIEAAEKNNVNLFVVKQNRYNPPVAKVKEIIDNGILGKIYMLVVNVYWNRGADYYSESEWKGRLALDGGTLYTQVSHFIDLMLWYGGDFKNVEIIGKRNKHQIEFEDNGVILAEFENGAIGSVNYTVCTEKENMEGSITVIAEHGTVKIGGQYLNTLEYEKIKNYKIPELEPSRPANDYGRYQGSMSNHAQVIQNVIDVLQNNGKQHVTATEALKTVEFIEHCYKKMKV
ncbi:MAG: Gfo/Idh/MocA family oxidoreductase [Bacteroidetes bacterium]|nr:MAG: Gfo/Idh/MocA family oxidoreductase [Bacteroidota bacterium]